MARNPYVKVLLLTPAGTNLTGGTIVGQSPEFLLVERPAAKARVKPATPRKPRAAKKAATAAPATEAANG